MRIKDSVFVFQLQEADAINWHSRYHYHGGNQYEIHYFIAGEGSFLNGSRKYGLEAGSLFITPPGVRHQIQASGMEHPISYYAILMEPGDSDGDLRGIINDEISWNRRHLIGGNYRFFFEEMREKSLSENHFVRKAAVHQLMSFLYMLASGDETGVPGHQENIHIEKGLRYMQEGVFKPVSLGDIASRLKLSEEYFIRLFKQKMKITPMKYLARLRIEAATSMLISSDMLIYQIADRLQFNSEFHFSRQFKKYTGYSPRQYRQNCRQIIGRSPEHESIIYMGRDASSGLPASRDDAPGA